MRAITMGEMPYVLTGSPQYFLTLHGSHGGLGNGRLEEATVNLK